MDENRRIDAMLETIQASLDTRIEDTEEIERLRKGIEGWLGRASTLRNYPLTNADEPDFVFGAYRSEAE